MGLRVRRGGARSCPGKGVQRCFNQATSISRPENDPINPINLVQLTKFSTSRTMMTVEERVCASKLPTGLKMSRMLQTRGDFITTQSSYSTVTRSYRKLKNADLQNKSVCLADTFM